MYLIPTLRRTEPMINTEAFLDVALKPLDKALVLIPESHATLSGQKAYVIRSFKIDFSDKQIDVITNIDCTKLKSGDLTQLWNNLSETDKFKAKTSGLICEHANNLVFFHANTIRGASGPALGSKASTSRNAEANNQAKLFIDNRELLAENVLRLTKLCASSLCVEIERFNQSVMEQHRPKMPSFVLTMLSNQKSRSYGTSSIDLDKYNTLASTVEQSDIGWSKFLKSASDNDLSLVRRVSNKLRKDLKSHIAKQMSADNYRDDYRNTIHSLIDALPDAPISTPCSDMAVVSLSKLTNSW